MYLLLVFLIKTLSPLVLLEPIPLSNLSPQIRPQDLLVTNYDCEDNQQKTLHKYPNDQVTQYESERQDIESTAIVATLYLKARATTQTGLKCTSNFWEKKVHCSQVSKSNKNKLDHESLYQSTILHLNHKGCKNKLQRLKIVTNKSTKFKFVSFQVFLEHYQGHIQLDDKFPYHGAQGRLYTCDLHNKN